MGEMGTTGMGVAVGAGVNVGIGVVSGSGCLIGPCCPVGNGGNVGDIGELNAIAPGSRYSAVSTAAISNTVSRLMVFPFSIQSQSLTRK